MAFEWSASSEAPAGARVFGARPPVTFAADADLLYAAEARRFEPGQPLRLDPDYRLKQLPLVNPDHPDVIRRDGRDEYADGRYPTARVSLVLFLAGEALAASPALQEVTAHLRASRLVGKIAWQMAGRRTGLLHATVGARLESRLGERAIETLVDSLAGRRPFSVQVKGPWVGARNNAGRLYLPLYPEIRDGRDCLAAIQQAFHGPETRFYAAGVHNLTDHLTAEEAADLAGIVHRYRETVLLTQEVVRLDVVATHDDLLLDSRIARSVQLGTA